MLSECRRVPGALSVGVDEEHVLFDHRSHQGEVRILVPPAALVEERIRAEQCACEQPTAAERQAIREHHLRSCETPGYRGTNEMRFGAPCKTRTCSRRARESRHVLEAAGTGKSNEMRFG